MGQLIGPNDQIVVVHVDEDGQHGLMAATFDVGGDGDVPDVSYGVWPGYRWSDNYHDNDIPTGDSIGEGKSNTWAIISEFGDPDQPGVGMYAAWLCHNLSVQTNDGELDDWFLPSNGELDLVFEWAREEFQAPDRKGLYWTSSQAAEPEGAKYINFYDGLKGSNLKTNRCLVRCVHEF